MKKTLFTLIAFAVALVASAETTLKAGDIQTIEMEGDTYKTVTISLDNQNESSAFQAFFTGGPEKYIVDIAAEGDIASEVKAGIKKVNVYNFTYSASSTMGADIPTCYAAFNTAAKTAFPEGLKVIESGEIFTIYLSAEATGVLTITGKTSWKENDEVTGGPFPTLEVNLDGTAVKAANADKNAEKANKYMTKKGIVITKGNKKYNAAAQEIK